MRSVPVPDPDNYSMVRGLSAGRKVFGRYVLETELGAGGMGVVWRARDGELGDLVIAEIPAGGSSGEKPV